MAGQRYFDTEDELDDAVAAWHDGDGDGLELHEYLGWTWEEYGAWVEIPHRRPRLRECDR